MSYSLPLQRVRVWDTSEKKFTRNCTELMSTPQIDKMGAEEKNNNKINLSIILIKS
jgi:hypothetical protein